MRIVATMPCRNDGWCLGLSLRVALLWCDAVVLLLHQCTDDSLAIAQEVATEELGRVRIIFTDGEWDEMVHRQIMLSEARAMGATHIAIVDADEVATANLLSEPRFASALLCMELGQMLQLPGYNLRDSLTTYHSSGLWAHRWFSCVFRDTDAARWSGDTFHHREPHGVNWQPWQPIRQGAGGILHLWGHDPKRIAAKHALYKITERLRWPNKPVGEIDKMYSLWWDEDTAERAATPASWWKGYEHLMHYLDLYREPWQIAEAQRIVAANPSITRGLDLFEVI